MGKAAFLFGLFATGAALHQVLGMVGRMEAASTAADLAEGIALGIRPAVQGTVVALVALAGSGLIRLRRT